MSRLTLKILRDIRGMWTRILLISGVVGLGVGTYASSHMGHDSLAYTRDTYFSYLHLADLELWTSVADPDELPDFSAIPEVGAVVRRFFTPGCMEKDDGTPFNLGLVYMHPALHYPVNDHYIIEGQPLSSDDTNGVVIDRTFATMFNYKVGQRFTINPYNNPREVTIRGIAIVPEFLIPTSHPDVLIPAKGSLGVVFLSMALITDVFDGPMYNDLSFRAAPGVSEERLKTVVLASLAGKLEMKKIIPKKHQFSALYIDENLTGYMMFLPINLTIFGVVVLLVTFLTMRRLLQNQSMEIGTLMAIGFSPWRIFSHYLLIGVVIGGLGAILGAGIAFPLCRIISVRYGDSMGLPTVLPHLDPEHLLIGMAAGFVASMVCAALPLLPLVRMQPHIAIRGAPSSPFRGIPLALQPVLDFLALGSAARRFALRNMFRRPGLTLIIVLLIAAAIGLSSSFELCLYSWKYFANTTFDKERWDSLATFRVPLSPKDSDPIMHTEGVDQALPFITGYAVLHDGDYERDMRIMGMAPPQGMRAFSLYEGHLLTSPDANEIIINRNFNRSHTFHLGSVVTLEIGKKKFDLPIVGLANDTTVALAIVPIGTARRIFDRGDKIDGFNATFKPGVAPKEMEKRFYAHEMVNYIALKEGMRAIANDFMRLITSLVQVSLGVSYLLAMLFMLVGLSMTVLERVGEYATLRSLGFGRRLIWFIVYYEVVFEGLFALILSVPLAYLITQYLRIKMGRAWFLIDYQYEPHIFLSIALPAMVFLLLAVVPLVIQVLRVPLASALRLKAFG